MGGTLAFKYIHGLVQDYSNSITIALELLQSCTKPLTNKYEYEAISIPLWLLDAYNWI